MLCKIFLQAGPTTEFSFSICCLVLVLPTLFFIFFGSAVTDFSIPTPVLCNLVWMWGGSQKFIQTCTQKLSPVAFIMGLILSFFLWKCIEKYPSTWLNLMFMHEFTSIRLLCFWSCIYLKDIPVKNVIPVYSYRCCSISKLFPLFS